MKFASHHKIVDGLNNQLLLSPKAPLMSVEFARYKHVKAISGLLDLHNKMVQNGHTEPRDPFLRAHMDTKDAEPGDMDRFQFTDGHRIYCLWVFSDLSAILCFRGPKHKHLRVIPWPLMIPRYYKDHEVELNILAKSPDAKDPAQRLFIAWDHPTQQHGAAVVPAFQDEGDHESSGEIREAFIRPLKSEAINIVKAFEAAAPLIIDLEDPAWKSMSDHVVPFFATIPNEPRDEKEAASVFANHLVDYIAVKFPESFRIFITTLIISPTVKENGTVEPIKIEINHIKNSQEISEILCWAQHLASHPNDPLELRGQIEQYKGIPKTLAFSHNSRNMSAHHRLEVLGYIQNLMEQYPLPAKQPALLRSEPGLT